MHRILLLPLSGYINRIQAIASAAILAQQIDAELSICWEMDAVVPVGANSVLSDDFCRRYVLTEDAAIQDFGCTLKSVPKYLNYDEPRERIYLAGNDLGEQHFMPELAQLLGNSGSPKTLIIAAGGKFFMPAANSVEADWQDEFRRRRQDFYRSVSFTPEIEAAVASQLSARGPYLALHLRYTDRSHQTPLDGAIRQALRNLSARSGITDLFIAGDNAAVRQRWTNQALDLGLKPWGVEHLVWDRASGGSQQAALVDWRLLTHAKSMVYFLESSFAVEAAVAGGTFETSIALAASPTKSAFVRGQRYLQAAVTYPKRHGWFNSQ
ncbi:MAG: hypothetical protein EXQ60_08010 [Candidatus Nanopelagicales bacterium]|nr:hypothetical protein [Candidatus Nanopelagicales bacterium]